jgi:hypothetical protein
VKSNIDNFKSGIDPRSLHYILEWEERFNQGAEHLFAIALEDSEHADDLRQCSPFGGILTDEERLTYIASGSDNTISGETTTHIDSHNFNIAVLCPSLQGAPKTTIY